MRAPDMGPPGTLNLPAGTTLDGVPLAPPAGVTLIETLVYDVAGVSAFLKASYPLAQLLRVHLLGAGGGGGGALATTLGNAALGAGGGTGAAALAEIDAAGIAAMPASAAVTVGAGGAGGDGLSAVNAGNGGASSFETGGGIITAPGGIGGGWGPVGAPPRTSAHNGTPPSAPSGPFLLWGVAGREPYSVIAISTTVGNGGVTQPAPGPFGAAGFSRGFSTLTNQDWTGFFGPSPGGGGMGGFSYGNVARPARAGAPGGTGLVVVEVWG